MQVAPSAMPVQMLTPPQELAQPQYEITESDRRRQQDIANAWNAYNGNFAPPLQKMPGQADDNVLSNRMQAIVDRGVDFLFGKELEISIEEGAPQAAQDFLDTTWGHKETRVPMLQKLAMSGAMAGQAFLRIVPEQDGSFRLVTVDPSTVFISTDPQDCDTVLLYCIEYSVDMRIDGRPNRVYYREEMKRIDPDSDGGGPFQDTDASWEIQHWSRIGDHKTWQASGEPITWSYTFPPLFSCQNLPKPHDAWGYPDITPDLIAMNDSLNLVQSNINRINKLFGAPIIYATGTGEDVIDVRPGRIIGLPLADSKIVAVNLQSDTANALAFANNLRSDIDEQSSVPGIATGRIADIPRGNVSGIALQLLFMPLLKKTDKKRCGYGELILDVSKALLILNRMSPDISLTLNWQEPLPSDDLAAVQAAAVKKTIGVSDATLLQELGYNPDEEMERNQSEDAVKLTNFSRGQGLPPLPADPSQAPAQEPAQFGGQP